jgi:CO/xanthine dehydrogenase FAD-binding subunit
MIYLNNQNLFSKLEKIGKAHLESDKMEVVYRPKTLNELDRILRENKTELTYIAGVTDLMVQEERWKAVSNLVDLSSIKEIYQTLEITESYMLIGSALPLSEIISNQAIQKKLPILVEACRQIGSVQIQNRATLGGNIANASPAGDSLTVLSVLDAEIWIGPRNDSEFEKLKIDQVILNPGETSLKDNRYIAYILIPFPREENQFWYFRKVGQRKAMAISKVSLAVLGWIKNRTIEEIRISTGSVSPQVKRATKTETILNQQVLNENLIEKAHQSIMEEVKPITDIRSTLEYRRWICGELLREALYLSKAQSA